LSTRIPFANSLIDSVNAIDLAVEVDGIQMNLDEVEEMRSRLITEIETRFGAKENR